MTDVSNQKYSEDLPRSGSGMDSKNLDDLQFMTSVDNSVEQNVPIPPVPTSINNSKQGTQGGMPPGGGEGYSNDGSGSGGMLQIFAQSSHPFPCIFHCLFKIAALLLYLLGNKFAAASASSVSGANFITVTVICILLLAADFWVVKNITGRLLVGLRWWNQVEPDGVSSRWIFESAENYNTNKFDSTLFWSVLYLTPIIWIFLFVVGLLKFNLNWLIVVSMAIGLSGANVYGYWQCSKDQKAKFQQMMSRGAEMGAISMIRNNVFGNMSSFASRLAGSKNGQQNSQGQPQATTYV